MSITSALNGGSDAKSTVRGRKVKPAVQALKDESAELEARVAALKDELKSLGDAIAERGAVEADRLREKGESLSADLVANSRESIQALSEQLTRIEGQLEQRVREKPLQSLGIAAGVGLVIAMLARR